MSTTETTSAINEKKNEETGTSVTSTDFKNFFVNYLSSIIFTISLTIFIVGTLGLYTTKVAQANILPDNIELAPYTIIDRVVKDIPIDINIMRPSFFSENKDTFSQKAIFHSQEYLDSFNNSFLCSLKKNAEDPNGGLSANASLFFSSVYDNIIAKNFLAINTIFFYLSYLPESLIMILYGFFGIFLWITLYFFNLCISIFYHIVSIPELFRNPSSEKPQHWESSENIGFFNFNPKLLFFCFIWWWIGMISAFLCPAFFTLYGLISPLYAKYSIKQNKRTFNVIDFIKNTFAYKKFFFFILSTISLFSNGIKNLGTNSVVGIIVAVVFAYFIGLYNNEMPESGTDGFTLKIRPKIKQAIVSDIDINNPKKVQICQSIPIDDTKIQKINDSGTYREVTKPKEVGGDSEFYDDSRGNNIVADVDVNKSVKPTTIFNENTPTINTSTVNTSSSIDSELESLQNELSNLENQLQDTKDNVGHQIEYSQYVALEKSLKPQIEELTKNIQELESKKVIQQPQLGGKNTYSKHNKKYNIKWT
jgi:hypothetical protein